MRWRRAIVAAFVGLGVTCILAKTAYPLAMNLVTHPIAAMLPVEASTRVFNDLVDRVIMVTMGILPAVLLAVLIHGLGKPSSHIETRCRNCNYILQDLAQPRCPEYGEGI